MLLVLFLGRKSGSVYFPHIGSAAVTRAEILLSINARERAVEEYEPVRFVADVGSVAILAVDVRVQNIAKL